MVGFGETSATSIMAQARQVLSGQILSGLKPLRLHFPSVSDVLRYNRAEGLFVGSGVHLRPAADDLFRMDGGYAVGRGKPSLLVSVQGEPAPIVPVAEAYWDEIRTIGPIAAAAPVISTLGAALTEEDWLDPYFVRGARVTLRGARPGVGPEVTLRWEKHLSAENVLEEGFRPMRSVDEGILGAIDLTVPVGLPAGGFGRVEATLGRLGERSLRSAWVHGRWQNRDRSAPWRLQGEVGSGKTLVALMSMLIAIDNGFQACIMAPTEILAQQHFASLSKFLDGMDVRVELLTGSIKKAAREPIHKGLLDGSLHILIGTHALIEDVVQFQNLGLVVIDEQHRFGVAQRARLWKKADLLPHVLVMTATPIPRTLAMTLYGDLDVSVIDELPPGRKPIITRHSYDSKRLMVFGFLKKQLAQGRQAYIVYPLIKESESMDYKDLEDGLESISRAFPPPNYQVSVVHGKMKPDEKEASM
ncbi:MAG: DEAD/DEAH box helicase, partial [Myxococcota bacterium]